MEMRRMGASGLEVSAIGLGGNTFGRSVDGEAAVDLIRRALNLGITFIDTADIYNAGRSEVLVGQAVADRRHQVIVATKVRQPVTGAPHEGGLSRRWIMRGAEDSLRRLQTDYIDLYQVHSPDDQTPLEETLRALDDLVHQGKVRYVGCSNYMAWELAYAVGISERLSLVRWISVQPHWNLLHGLDDEHLLPACRRLGVGMIPYAPLASGILTGKYRAGESFPPGTRAADQARVAERITPERLAAVERLRPWTEERGHSLAELAIAWLLAYPEVATVIAGARRLDQVESNLRALSWSLSAAERDEVASIARGEPAVA